MIAHMNAIKKISGLCLTLGLLIASEAAWARAEILLLPTRIVMESGDRYVTVIARNTGDATANLRLELVDMAMQENGKVIIMTQEEKDPYSAIPFLRLAPLSMTLKPQASQTIRILLRKPQELEAGEYRSHLKVNVEDDNVEETEAKKKADTKETSISVKARLAFTIPVIFRTGETSIAVKFDKARVVRNEQGKPVLSFALLKEGNRSVMGDFAIGYSAAGGKMEVIKNFPGVPIYRSTPRREVLILLDDLPANVDLSKGKMNIVYTAQAKEGGMKLAETEFDLPGN